LQEFTLHQTEVIDKLAGIIKKTEKDEGKLDGVLEAIRERTKEEGVHLDKNYAARLGELNAGGEKGY